MKRLAFLLLFWLNYFNTFSQTGAGYEAATPVDERAGSSLSAFWHNDIFFKTDYYYTNGLGIEWTSPLLRIRLLDNIAPFPGIPVYTEYKFRIAQQIYTPQHISRVNYNEGDRPYAAGLVMRWTRQQYSNTRTKAISITSGTIGVSAGGEQTQNFIHDVINNGRAMGWYAQVNNDLLINIEQRSGYRIWWNPLADLSGGFTIAAGTMETFMAGHMMLRFGRRNFQFGSSGLRNQDGAVWPWSLFFFLKAEGKILFHDATLHGGLFSQKDQHFLIDYPTTKPFQPALEAGMAVSRNNWSLILQARHNRPLFNGGLPHTWGGLTIRYHY